MIGWLIATREPGTQLGVVTYRRWSEVNVFRFSAVLSPNGTPDDPFLNKNEQLR
jgi:hypothetical protein